ncbi:hypothetical protein LEP1GSC052_0829 [Leptospira kmetyi serovar Malaysia str. Bejo-Iso9]|nr:hypothetical protein LEP1GSC052_0829 [Leptospira kmetyi serovar Malaysia str. Bejo-Iso9]
MQNMKIETLILVFWKFKLLLEYAMSLNRKNGNVPTRLSFFD